MKCEKLRLKIIESPLAFSMLEIINSDNSSILNLSISICMCVSLRKFGPNEKWNVAYLVDPNFYEVESKKNTRMKTRVCMTTNWILNSSWFNKCALNSILKCDDVIYNNLFPRLLLGNVWSCLNSTSYVVSNDTTLDPVFRYFQREKSVFNLMYSRVQYHLYRIV